MTLLRSDFSVLIVWPFVAVSATTTRKSVFFIWKSLPQFPESAKNARRSCRTGEEEGRKKARVAGTALPPWGLLLNWRCLGLERGNALPTQAGARISALAAGRIEHVMLTP